MTMVRIWTAVSYNWSAGNTHINTFNGPHDSPETRAVFEKQYPGESLVALVPGDHRSSSVPFPLSGPAEGSLSLNKDG
mgnify:CR=1 FL=1